jgi:hypothetical protein
MQRRFHLLDGEFNDTRNNLATSHSTDFCADVACDDPVGIPDGVSIVEKCLADTNNPVPAGFEKREVCVTTFSLVMDAIQKDGLSNMATCNHASLCIRR